VQNCETMKESYSIKWVVRCYGIQIVKIREKARRQSCFMAHTVE
jgi:hypothetical protein